MGQPRTLALSREGVRGGTEDTVPASAGSIEVTRQSPLSGPELLLFLFAWPEAWQEMTRLMH